MKTIKELNEKTYYRFLKVIYILTIPIFGIFIYIITNGSYINAIIITIIMYEILRRSLYYILLGTIFPKN